jgi:hypothetical protein
MNQLNKRENVWSAAIGVLLGSMAGLMISLSLAREYKKCEVLKRENRLLREMVMFYQDQQVEHNVDSVFVCGE